MDDNEILRQIELRIQAALDRLGTLSQLNALDLTALAQANFTAYTPTFTPGTGAFTLLGAVSGRYCKAGRLIFFQASSAITTNGTAAQDVRFTLPTPASPSAAFDYIVSGRAIAVSFKELQGRIGPSSSNVVVTNYDNTYPGANGETIVVSGFYESAN